LLFFLEFLGNVVHRELLGRLALLVLLAALVRLDRKDPLDLQDSLLRLLLLMQERLGTLHII
jgi:hypothetical protein